MAKIVLSEWDHAYMYILVNVMAALLLKQAGTSYYWLPAIPIIISILTWLITPSKNKHQNDTTKEKK